MASVIAVLTSLTSQGHIPQDTLTELVTTLQDIYNRTNNGGHGSRKAVIHSLLILGLMPNK